MKVTKEKKIEKNSARERLIKNMQDLLWERGYVGTSPKAVQEKADVGQGSMYHHFSGKQELAAEAIKRTSNELLLRTENLLSEGNTAYNKIESYLLYKRDILKGCRIGGLTQDPDIINNEDLRELVGDALEKMIEKIENILEEGKKNNEFRDDIDAHSIATMIIAVLQGAYVLAKGENSIKPFEEAINGVLGTLKCIMKK